MKKIKMIWNITKNILLYERAEKRVIMGFLVGMAMPFWRLKGFLDYAAGTGEPVNILEAFLVIEHEGGSILFLTLGWFLVICDAPFINGNTYYSLYRTKKRYWNSAMVLYIFVQAGFYTVLTALPTVLASLPCGFAGKMWSDPVYMLSLDIPEGPGAEYGIVFWRQDMMRGMSVPQAFAATALCLFLYLAVMGMILYTLSLPAGGVWGVAVTFLVEIGGFGLSFLGFGKLSLSTYSMPGNFADYGGVHLVEPVGKMLLLAMVLVVLENLLVSRVDFGGRASG